MYGDKINRSTVNEEVLASALAKALKEQEVSDDVELVRSGNVPQCQDLYEENGYTPIVLRIVGTTAQNVDIWKVFRRESDETFWKATFSAKCGGHNGELHGLRTGDAYIEQVWPSERNVKVFLTEEEKEYESELGVIYRSTV